MKIHKIEQGTDEWFELRKGKMTASHAQAIGSCGKGLETYVYEKMADFYSSGEKDFYTNMHIDRGNELEPIARNMYELETGNNVEQVGFIERDEYVGCSPDGLVGDEGGIEIKCVNDVSHLKMMLGDKIDSKYIWQIQMNLLITGRKWWDYVSYNPNFKKSLVIIRVEPDKGAFEKLEKGFEIGKKMIKEITNKLK